MEIKTLKGGMKSLEGETKTFVRGGFLIPVIIGNLIFGK